MWATSALLIILLISITYKNYNFENITFYTSKLLTTQEIAFLKKLTKKQLAFLNKDPLYEEEIDDRKIDVFLIKNSWLYSWIDLKNVFVKLFNSAYRKGFSINSTIVINGSINPLKKTIMTNKEIEKTLTHELVHVLQHQKYGYLVTLFQTPKWVAEGYPTYRTHLYSKTDINKLRNTRTYKHYAKLIKYAVEIKSISINSLYKGLVEYDSINTNKINVIANNPYNLK
jgi:hypothetical protein